MFLLERIVGIGTYAFFLLLTCVLITKKNSRPSRILKFYTLILSIMGFIYVPYVTSDLYRIYEILDYFSTLSFSTFYQTRFVGASNAIANLYYWLISRIGIFQLLPFITAFVCYNCIFYIVIRTAKLYNIEKKYMAVTVFFLMATSTYMFVITGIRCMLSLSLIAFCFFRETTEKKKAFWHVLLYITAALFHNFAVVILAVRLILPLFDKTQKSSIRILYVGFLCALVLLLPLYATNLLEAVFEKAEEYLQGGYYSYFWEYVVAVICLVLIFFAITCSRPLQKNYNDEFLQAKHFCLVCAVLAILFCFEFTIFHRLTTYILPIIAIPIFMMNLSNMRKRHNAVFYNVLLIASVIMFLVSCARGSLCSYKFFVLS